MAPLCKGSCQRKLTEGLSNSYSETKEPRNVLGWALGGSSFIMCCVEGANPWRGFPLFSAELKIHPFLRFMTQKRIFALCGGFSFGEKRGKRT